MIRAWSVNVGLMLALVGGLSAQPPLVSNYYPLEVGHRWIYRAIDLKSPQPKFDSKRKTEIVVESEVSYALESVNDAGVKVQKKYTGFALKSTSGDKILRDHVVVMENGVYKIHTAGTQLNPPVLFFKLTDLKPGKTWDVDSTGGNVTMKGTFSAKVTSVKVPLSTEEINTYLISFSNNKKDDDRIEIDFWFADKIGMVKQRVKSKNHEIVLELEKFEQARK